MTDDSIEAKALALVNEICLEKGVIPYAKLPNIEASEALCRAIEQHEAFRQEVSDVMTYIKELYPTLPRNFHRFIIPKPDPLVEVISEIEDGTYGETKAEYAAKLRAALDARGLEIRSKNDD